MLVSIITPTFNEEDNIEKLFDAIGSIFKNSKYAFEHIVVDNCSTDRTVEIAKNYANEKNYPLKIIINNENYGPDYSPMVGFRESSGDVVIPIVADLQDPPELILEMFRKYEANTSVDLICCINNNFSHTRDKLSKNFYKVLKLIKKETIENFQGYGLYSRKLVNHISNDPYRYFYFRGVAIKYAIGKEIIFYKKKPRQRGKSYYSILKIISNIIIIINYYYPNLFLIIGIFISLIILIFEFNEFIILIIMLIISQLKNVYRI
jgi:glycosyltransferase involved in cell wall biosynthesis